MCTLTCAWRLLDAIIGVSFWTIAPVTPINVPTGSFFPTDVLVSSTSLTFIYICVETEQHMRTDDWHSSFKNNDDGWGMSEYIEFILLAYN